MEKEVYFSRFSRNRFFIVENEEGHVIMIRKISEYGKECVFGLIDEAFKQSFLAEYGKRVDSKAVAYFKEKDALTLYGDFGAEFGERFLNSMLPIEHYEKKELKTMYAPIDLPEKLVNVVSKRMSFEKFVREYWQNTPMEIKELQSARRYQPFADYKIMGAYEKFLKERRKFTIKENESLTLITIVPAVKTAI